MCFIQRFSTTRYQYLRLFNAKVIAKINRFDVADCILIQIVCNHRSFQMPFVSA
jgi:hypothetical protein